MDLFAIDSFAVSAFIVASETGLFASLVLSTFDKSTIFFEIPNTVPVNVVVPVKVGEALGALRSKAFWAKLEIGLSASEVLSTLAKLTMLFESPPTLPVNVGLLMGALSVKPGTVGEEAVPPKSPVNFIFPAVLLVASTTSVAILEST